MSFILLADQLYKRHGYARNRVDNEFLLIVWRCSASVSRREYHTGDKTDTDAYSLREHIFTFIYRYNERSQRQDLKKKT